MHRTKLIALILAVVTLALYWPVTGFDFVNYDDPDYVTGNQVVQSGLTWHGVVWAFTTGHASNWHPLTWLSHMLACQFAGLKSGWHHFTNVLFHTANTLLLFGLLRRLTGATWRGAIVAALFAWHPVHVESVAWVSERKDVLSTFFFLLTLWSYAEYVRPPDQGVEGASQPKARGPASTVFYAAALLCFALGLMAKPMLVTLPFVLLLLDYWPLGRMGRLWETDGAEDPLVPRETRLPKASCLLPLAWEKVPFFILAAVSSIITFIVQRKGGGVPSLSAFAPGLRLENAPVSYVRHLGHLLWPGDLACFYPHPVAWPASTVAGAGLLVLGISIATLRLARSRPALAVGWFWFLGTLVPVIGIVQTGAQAMADRHAYIPSIGLFVALVWTAYDWLSALRWHRQVLSLSTALILGLCLVTCWKQEQYWRNTETLFRHALDATTGNFVAHAGLGVELAQQDRLPEAINHYTESIAINPRVAATHNDLGCALVKTGKPDEAVTEFRRALELDPLSADADANLGDLLSQSGKLAEADEHFRHALRSNPGHLPAHRGLGLLLAARHDLAGAIAQFQALVQLQPKDADALYNLGALQSAAGNSAEAARNFSLALAINGRLPEKYKLSGDSLAAAGNLPAAASSYLASLRLRPDPETCKSLGLVLARSGEIAGAITNFAAALRLNPRDAGAHYDLGLAFMVQGDIPRAIQSYQAALRLNPDLTAGLNDLAWLLATHPKEEFRNGPEAVRLAERACELTRRKEARYLGTLDAAYAEAGRLDDAIATARQTAELALAAGQPELAEAAKKRETLYRSGHPYRQP